MSTNFEIEHHCMEELRWHRTTAEISLSDSEVAHTLGYYSLKTNSSRLLLLFCKATIFVALPTGYGISLCFPSKFDLLLKTEGKSIIVVISPLKALMKDQVSKFSTRGLSAAYIAMINPNMTSRIRVV